MTKAKIVSQISKNTGIEKVLVMEVIENMMECVKDSLESGENVYLRGFGSFILKERAEKTARNILRNTSIIVPAHSIPAFKPSKEFMDKVREVKSNK
ncbi:MAG: HU family DNA-binding protein [Rikenellaceae bacterium]